MNTEENKEYYTEVHNQIIGWTGNCDTKASIVLAFVVWGTERNVY